MNYKKLGLFDATLLVSGSMIGSGIFIVTADMSRLLGNPYLVIFAWIVTGVITLMAALSFGELSSMMPTAGGQYNFISRIYGRVFGFVYGWTVFSVIQTGVIAAVAMAFAKYFGVFVPSWGTSSFIFQFNLTDTFTLKLSKAQLVAVSMIAFLTYINTRGVQEGKWIQRIFTLAKLIALFSLILGGVYLVFGGSINGVNSYFNHNFNGSFESANFIFNNKNSHLISEGHWSKLIGLPLLLAFSSAMVGSLFSSDAWQGITFMSNEIENPSKNIPKALFWGTTVVTLVYVLANLAYMALLPMKGIGDPVLGNQLNTVFQNGISHASDDRVGAAAESALMGVAKNESAGQFGMLFMAGLIMVSTFGCNNGLILAGSRLYKAMSDQGLFFKNASKLNKKNVPHNALWMQCIWASLLCFSGSYGDLLNYCTFASLLFYIVTVVGLLILRKREPNAERPYKVWGYPFVPILYVILAGMVAIGILWSQWNIALNGLFIVGLGYPIYFFFNRKSKLDTTN